MAMKFFGNTGSMVSDEILCRRCAGLCSDKIFLQRQENYVATRSLLHAGREAHNGRKMRRFAAKKKPNK